jgi:hypothetical protein
MITIFSILQYDSVLNLGKIALEREQFLLRYSSLALEMETNLYKAHRSALSSLLANSNAELEQEAENRSTCLERYWTASSSLNALFQLSSQHQSLPTQYTQSFDNYKLRSDEMTQMLRAGKHKEALGFRNAIVRPSFDEWKAQHDSFVIDLLNLSKMMNMKYASETLFLQRITLILLLFPVAAVGLSLFALLIVFRDALSFGGHYPSQDLWAR